MKSTYVAVMRAVRALLASIGVLRLLDSRRSRRATWLRSLLAIYDLDDLVRLDIPWWTFDSSDHVAAFLAGRDGARAFEWGSGASSLWLASRCSEVVSVEHDPEWAERVRRVAHPNMRILTVPPSPITPARPAVTSAKAGATGLDFDSYVSAIDGEDGSFDLIVVDGRAREACLDAAIPRLRPDGIIVFDNVERERYRDAIARHDGTLAVTWTRGLTPCLPYPTRTALLRRRHGV